MPKPKRGAPPNSRTPLGRLRVAAGLSCKEAARRSGLSRGGLSNIEAGVYPASQAAIARIAKALRVPIRAVVAALSRTRQTSPRAA